jgi:hypothetical protein
MSQMNRQMAKTIDEAFALFCDKAEKERFVRCVESLGEFSLNFLRACRIYGQTVKCKSCNRDVAMAMLCSAIESVQGKRGRPYTKFVEFLMKNCPLSAQNSPMRIFVRKDEIRQASFEESISYVYGNFRSLFLHEGIGRVTAELPPGLERAGLISSSLADKHKHGKIDKIYIIELLHVLDWFDNVVKQSLWQFLTRRE